MPRDTYCYHPNCDGEPCKMLTPEELKPTDADIALGRQLVAEGWIQTSRKFRHVRRWRAPAPRARDMIAPEYRDTAWGRRAIAAIERSVTSSSALHSEYPNYDVTLYGPMGPPRKAPDGEVGCYEIADGVERNPLIEERTLTVREFTAYRHACAAAEREKRNPSPEHSYTSELGEWPGQTDRESPRTQTAEYRAGERARSQEKKP